MTSDSEFRIKETNIFKERIIEQLGYFNIYSRDLFIPNIIFKDEFINLLNEKTENDKKLKIILKNIKILTKEFNKEMKSKYILNEKEKNKIIK